MRRLRVQRLWLRRLRQRLRWRMQRLRLRRLRWLWRMRWLWRLRRLRRMRLLLGLWGLRGLLGRRAATDGFLSASTAQAAIDSAEAAAQGQRGIADRGAPQAGPTTHRTGNARADVAFASGGRTGNARADVAFACRGRTGNARADVAFASRGRTGNARADVAFASRGRTGNARADVAFASRVRAGTGPGLNRRACLRARSRKRRLFRVTIIAFRRTDKARQLVVREECFRGLS
jgi:hypothetical protein